MKNVYQLPQKIKLNLKDRRSRRSIPLFNIVMPVILLFILQYESFHAFFSAPERMGKRLRNCIRGRIPKVDAVRDFLSCTDPHDLQGIHEEVVDRVRRNGILRGGTVGGYVVAAIDGVELFSSTKRHCGECLHRTLKSGETEHFHRSVVCGTVGKSPHLVLGQEMLHPRDGSEKEEGELTGAKRLICRLRQRHGHFADVIVADALYLNSPFINMVLQCGMDAVIRMKDEKRLIFKDAEALFQAGEGLGQTFRSDGVEVEVWDLSGFEMEGVKKGIRVVRFRETRKTRKGVETRMVWLVTTLQGVDPQILWIMMHRRWDVENNVFHQLKTYYHAKHCYCHDATETLWHLMLLAFNMRELYLFRRVHRFAESGMTRKEVSGIFRDDLLLNRMHDLLYDPGG